MVAVVSPTYEYSTIKAWRKQVAAKWNHQCVDCGRTTEGVGRPLQAHHLVPQNVGGKSTIANGILLCPDCHEARHSYRDPEALAEQIARRVVDLVSQQQVYA